MKIKKIAAFAAACVVLLFGVWACSDYAGRESLKPTNVISEPLSLSGVTPITTYSQHVAAFGQGQTPPAGYVPTYSGGVFSLATLYLHTTIEGEQMEIYVFPDMDSRNYAVQNTADCCDKVYAKVEIEGRPTKEMCTGEGDGCRVVYVEDDEGFAHKIIIVCLAQ